MTSTNAPSSPAWLRRQPACHGRGQARPPVLQAIAAQADGRAVLTLAGEIDLTTTDLVRDAAARCLEQRPACLALDLGSLTFCDCAGVRTLQWTLRQATAAHAAFRLTTPRPQIRRVLTLTGADDLLAAADTPAAPQLSAPAGT